MNVWLLFVIMGAGTFALRFSFMYLLGRLQLSERVTKALGFVPPTVMMSLIVPALLRSGGEVDFSWGNERLLAGGAAVLVAAWTENVVLTIAAGMAGLYLFGRLL